MYSTIPFPARKGALMAEVIIKFSYPAEQTHNYIKRIVGFVKIKSLIPLIDQLDLDANPRSSKTGAVVTSIDESLSESPDIFPFMTKGILLAATGYQQLERGRYRVVFDDLETEGILDGGHNMLAIGLFILSQAQDRAASMNDTNTPDYPSERDIKHVKNWDSFKTLWNSYKNLIAWYQNSLHKEDNIFNPEETPLDTFVPVELLVPTDPDDGICLDSFRMNLLDICAARNNNVQLATSTKANQHGYFDSLKKLLKEANPDLADRVEWKSNAGGDIKPQDIITLCWIPLALLPGIADKTIRDDSNKPIEAPSPVSLYSGKEIAMSKFERLMSSKDVTEHNNSQGALKNLGVQSALRIAAQIPVLYDYIYANLPASYNHNGGRYGKIKAIEALKKSAKAKKTPFGGAIVDCPSPQGFIAPLVYGLQSLMEVKKIDGTDCIVWRNGINPEEWLSAHLDTIVKRYSNTLTAYNFDPQKVGKAIGSYETAIDCYKLALLGL